MNTEERKSEKFIEGQRVGLIGGQGAEGVVTGYEYYHGTRVWIRTPNGLNYAYLESELEALDEVNVVTCFEDLTKAAENHAAPVITISRRMARDLLDYIAELEGKVEAAGLKELDNVSDLKTGDEVEAMIDYTYHKKGDRGIVESVRPDEEYPIKVKYKGYEYPVGYKRHELGKVN